MMVRFAVLLAVCLVVTVGSWAAPLPGVEHVVIIGVDGLSPQGIEDTDTPHMDRLIAEGAHTYVARAVMPTSSSSNWASMIMGAGPEQHGITSNGWELDKFSIAPTVQGPGGMFPTIFSVVREQLPDANTACFYDWGGFGRLFERDLVTKEEDTKGPAVTTKQAAKYIRKQKPLFTFIHLDHVDHAGHADGWYTESYNAAVREADDYIGEVIGALEESGILEKTVLIVTSDHGGKGTGHGGSTMGEILIPWIVRGPGVVAGKTLADPVNTYDTAATAAWALGVTPPKAWIARPVKEAFGKD